MTKNLTVAENDNFYITQQGSHFLKSSSPLAGSDAWTAEGEWLDKSSQKIRLMMGSNPRSYIALREEKPSETIYERVKNYFTHISVITQDGQSISLNLGSLSKRTHLSFAMILLLRLRGKLTLDLVEKSLKCFEENCRPFDEIVSNGRKKAIADKEDPDTIEKELKEVIQTTFKSRRLAKGVFSQFGNRVYIAHKDDLKHRFTILEFSLEPKKDFLGEGTYGMVFQVRNLLTNDVQAFKVAKLPQNKVSLSNELQILARIHSNGPVRGIQETPYYLLSLLQTIFYSSNEKVIECKEGESYVAPKYDFTLFDLAYLKGTSLGNKILQTESLFYALNWLHTNGIIHCDIKTANCCSQNGELKIADFGHVRLFKQVTPDQPLDVCTPYFTCQTDTETNRKISRTYLLHQLARGNVKTPAAKIRILHSALNHHPLLKKNIKEAKVTIAYLLLKLTPAKLEELTPTKLLDKKMIEQKLLHGKIGKIEREKLVKKLQDKQDQITAEVNKIKSYYQTEIDLLKKDPYLIWKNPLDLSKFLLSEEQMEELYKESIELCKHHDIYGLGVSLLCIYLGVPFISPDSIGPALKKFAKDPELATIKPELVDLLQKMLNKNSAQRPSIQEAYGDFKKIIDKISPKPTATIES